ncbi:Sorting nexin mvp1 [Boothiomyces macroporosus]|uniref:Sorting nexin MVP1 n=1 Tax=Boothiomyces macroporosus TaxID=261099 RepID=A0AAD5Y8E3_9FUNG|nr:Sorting nexin mvp1 [Boothiomyces macroporosus]
MNNLLANPWDSETPIEEQPSLPSSSLNERGMIFSQSYSDDLPNLGSITLNTDLAQDPWKSNENLVAGDEIFSNSVTLPPFPPSKHEDNVPQTQKEISYQIELKKLDQITVELEEKHVSLFGHLNYIVKSKFHGSSVSRRYSDVLWLQNHLLKKYPFRIITSIPPKKAVGVDAAFIEQRRKGLSRFMNFIANHPVISKDPQIHAFFTCEATFQSYRNSNVVENEEEFNVNQVQEDELASVPELFESQLLDLKTSLKPQIDYIFELIGIMERYAHRSMESALDYRKLAVLLSTTKNGNNCFVAGCTYCGNINEQCDAYSDGLEGVCNAHTDQAYTMSMQIVEDLKSYRDLLTGFQIMLTRREMAITAMASQNIARRITGNKNRLVEVTAKGGGQKEIDRITNLINQDEREQEYQVARTRFIEWCVYNEYRFLHDQKSSLVTLLTLFLETQIKFSSQYLSVI